MISEKKERVVGSSSSSKPVTQVRLIVTRAIYELKERRIILTLCMPIAKRRIAHVRQLDVAF